MLIVQLRCDGEWCECPECRRRFRRRDGWGDDRMRHACRGPRPGLGDLVAAGLASIGITEERVQQAASRVGIKNCGCGRRKARLNELGRQVGIG